MSLLAELKRRNVLRVAGLYLATSWLVLQLTDVLGSLLDLPKGVGIFDVAVAVVGFPVALAVAWIYELTPEGLRRDTESSLDPVARRLISRRLNLLTLGVALTAIAAVIVDRTMPVHDTRARDPPELDTDGVGTPPFAFEQSASWDPAAASSDPAFHSSDPGLITRPATPPDSNGAQAPPLHHDTRSGVVPAPSNARPRGRRRADDTAHAADPRIDIRPACTASVLSSCGS